MFITAGASMALQGAGEYGTTVYPSTFDPECNAYEHHESGGTYLKVKSTVEGEEMFIDTLFSEAKATSAELSQFPMQFFVNTTNQPSFADGKICDEYIRFYDTSLSKGEFAAVPVRGTVRMKMNLFDKEMTWPNALGVRVDSAFIENHMVSCEGLRGYTGRTGEQQVEIAGASSTTIKYSWSSVANATFLPLYNGLQVAISNLITPTRGVPK
jgi:hypothetical protein